MTWFRNRLTIMCASVVVFFFFFKKSKKSWNNKSKYFRDICSDHMNFTKVNLSVLINTDTQWIYIQILYFVKTRITVVGIFVVKVTIFKKNVHVSNFVLKPAHISLSEFTSSQ